jgi:WD40 repeat protein
VDGAPVDVGGGGEGLVYQARRTDGDQERVVALKMHTALTLDDFERFAERARTLSEIDHPHVMHLVDAFVGSALIDDDDPPDDAFGVMCTVADWIPGLSLPAALEATGAASGLHWVSQVARAAAYLHDFRSPEAPAGLVHRDIKPSNVRITPDEQAVLIDFGIARPHQEGDHTEGAGTYLWRAPEVLGGPDEPGPASDVWGVGALAYWVLLAEPPRLDGAEAARELLIPAARSAGFVDPKDLGRRISEMLETHPQRRPGDLRRWADDMDRRAAGRPPVPLRRVAAIAAVILVIAGAVTATVVSLGRHSVPSPAQSRALAADAVGVLPHDVGLGSLLSLASYTRAPTAQARGALVDAIEQPLRTMLHDGSPISSLAYNRSGTLLATGDAAGNVTLWDTATRAPIHHFRIRAQITSIALGSDGTSVAIGDSDGSVVLWMVTRRSEDRTYPGDGKRVMSVAFSHHGDDVVIGDAAGRLALWDPTDGSTRLSSTPDYSPINSVAVDPADPPLVAIGDDSADPVFWDTAHRISYVPTGGGGSVTSVAFSPDGQIFATGDSRGQVTLWRTSDDAEVLPVLSVGSDVHSLAFSPDGGSLAVGDANGGVTRWNTASHQEIGQPYEEGSSVNSVAFSPDSSSIAAGDDAGNAVVWTATSDDRTLAPADAGSLVDSVASSRVGNLVATADYLGSVFLWNAATGREIGRFPGVGSQILSVALDRDGFRLATGDKAGHVVLWDTLTGNRIWLRNDGSRVYSVAFSPDGKVLASGDAAPQAILRVAATGAVIGHPLVDPRHSSVRSVTFSPDGDLFATGDEVGDATIWRVGDQTEVGSPLPDANGHIVWSVAFSPTGTILAAGDDDGSTTLWKTTTGHRIRRMSDDGRVLSVAFSGDGRTLATGTAAGTIETWDVATGMQTSPPLRVNGQVYSIAFSSDGSTLAVASDEPTVALVPSVVVTDSIGELASSLCEKVRGNLTAGEWIGYVGSRVPYQKVCPRY